MLVLDKICMTVSHTTFVHMGCYNQHKMKVPWRGFNIYNTLFNNSAKGLEAHLLLLSY